MLESARLPCGCRELCWSLHAARQLSLRGTMPTTLWAFSLGTEQLWVTFPMETSLFPKQQPLFTA